MISTIVVYNSILLISTFLIWLSSKYKSKHKQNFCLCVSFLIVFVPAAIRYYIAEDYFGYVSVFDRIAIGTTVHVEPAFYYLVKLIHFFNGNVQWLFIITSFLIYYFLFKSYKDVKSSWVLHFSFCILFYLETYNVVRAAIALCMVMYAANLFIKKESLIMPFLFIFAASLFHKGALLSLPVFLIGNDRFIFFFNKYKLNYFILFLLIISLFFKEAIVNVFANSSLVRLLGYEEYLESDIYMQIIEFKSGVGFYIKILLLLLPLFFYNNLKLNVREKFVYSSFVYCCAFTFILSSVYFIFMRANYVFFAGFFYSFVLAYSIRNNFLSRVILFGMALFYLILFEMFIINNTSDKCASTRINPYVTIFNKESDNSIKLVYKDCIKIYGEDD